MDQRPGEANDDRAGSRLGIFLTLGCGGLLLLFGGLVWDVAMHSADTDLAAHEGPLTLTNPSHLVAALGVVLTAVGMAGAMAVARPRRGQRGRAIAAALAGGVVLAGGGGVVWAESAGHGDHPEEATGATGATDSPHAHDDSDRDKASSEPPPVVDGDEPVHEHGVTADDADTAADAAAGDAPETHGHSAGADTAATADEGSAEPLCAEAEGHANHNGLVVHGETDAEITAEDCAAADAWFEEVVAATSRFVSLDTALTEGYVAVDDSLTVRHYAHSGYGHDGVLVDEEHPEGLVYYVGDGEPVLLGILFTGRGDDLPRPGGTLTQWHDHSSQGCPESTPDCGSLGGGPPMMLHAWVFDGVGDRFAHDFPGAVGEGQTAVPGRAG